jgi:hypothetical protein
MKTFAVDHTQQVLSKQHESKLQELRHERESESLRLDGLKKVLQSKLDRASRNELQVA